MIGSGLGGCAGNPARDTEPSPVEAAESLDLERLPQMLLPGAMRSEVKSFAMGAARSKGWIIDQSSDDRLVVHRPIDANALSNVTPGASGSAPGPGSLLEVTSYFVAQSGGLNVATRADLVTPMPGAKAPARTDYTENLRDSLTQSLESLRDAWSGNRGRIARATPPAEGWKDAWSKDAASAGSATATGATVAANQSESTPVRVAPPLPPANALPLIGALPPAPKPIAKPIPEPIAKATQPPIKPVAKTTLEPAKPAIKAAPPPTKPVAKIAPEPANPATKAAPPPIKPATKIAQEPAKPATKAAVKPGAKAAKPAGAAPVVDATTASSKRPPAPKPTGAKTGQANMMELPKPRTPVASSVSWASQAENYARQHGCKIGKQGANLIESRKDGEIHKISCVGTDSVLVKCQKGTCKSLL
jgi:hypothetical protein